jgi:hypothetical protein
MRPDNLILIFAILISQSALSQESIKYKPISMINDVNFVDSAFDKLNIGNGFLVVYGRDTFAVTAKHILLFAETDSMGIIHFENGLKQWTMYPKDKISQTVIMDKLLNEDRDDSLEWGYINRNWDLFNDWLIFKIKDNKAKVKPLEIRKSELTKGELLYVVGWTYNDSEGEQRIYEYEYYNSNGTHFNMRRIKTPENEGGLSGSPVVDSDGFLVGIISGIGEDPETKEKFSAPCRVDYLIEFLDNLK